MTATAEAPALAVEHVPVADLLLYPGNPKVGNVDAIAESLTANGQYKPIVAQTSTRHVIVGNHTLQAARKLGWESIAVIWADVDDDRARRILLADNRTPELGKYDRDALAEFIGDIGIDLTGTGWTLTDAAKILETAKTEDADTEDLQVVWGVIAECETEEEQAALLTELDERGLRVRAMMM